MPKALDPRVLVGNRVHTRAKLLTSDSKCRRLYGALWKTKVVNGTVLKVTKPLIRNRKATIIHAKWELSDGTKVVGVHLCSVKAAEVPGTVTQQTVQQNNEPNDIGEAEDVAVPETDEEVTQSQGALESSTRPRDSDTASLDGPVITCHDRDWKQSEVPLQINGPVTRRPWKVIGPVDEIISHGHGPSDMKPFDYFMWMFPGRQLTNIREYTNNRLCRRDLALTTRGEILKFFGVLILMTRCEFSDRRSLWSPTASSKYLAPQNFGDIMSRQRFEDLRQNMVFSKDCDTYGRWGLISEFIAAINDHRSSQVIPSDRICADEGISRWYGLGGDWIDIGLPHYVALERKPEHGCELKTAACGRSGICLRIETVVSAQEMSERDYEGDNSHGAAVLMRLVEPWFQTNRVVCADSFFASVHSAERLFDHGLRFTGVIKTATKSFPMTFLSHMEMSGKGEHVTMVSKRDDSPELMAVMWVDRGRRYFVSSAGTTNPGTAIYRERWVKKNGATFKEQSNIGIPDVCEKYYETCSEIDRHNRCRQDDLKLEKKFEVKDWSTRVNTSLLGICIVDDLETLCGISW